MAVIRSVDTIIAQFLDYYRNALPDADTKPGEVIRDLFIDAPAIQIANLYQELSDVSNKQSYRSVQGTDLDKLGKNFGIIRNQAAYATGTAILTFNDLSGPFNISAGGMVYANNGVGFTVLNSVVVSPSSASLYKANAVKYRNDLSYVGISDTYAIEVLVKATTPGLSGNIVKYSLNRSTIANISNATNVLPFKGGTNVENDTVYRNRILSKFSGSSTGTAVGYLNTALSIPGVQDAKVIEPGDPLMTRDGTQTKTLSDGTVQIVSEGTGGKVDVQILGQSLAQSLDTYIYKDKSNNNDPTSTANDVVLGQIPGDENKTVSMRRRDNIKNKALPLQPVSEIIEVSGSLSGSNYLPKSTDDFGRVSGNYELIKDTGAYTGTTWGFDKLHWISDHISLYKEDKNKGQLSGHDAVNFSDVLQIPQIKQNISITNENSLVNASDPSTIQLLHSPVAACTRVFNTNTGETYTIINQNLDPVTSINTYGKVQISGSTLPSTTDVLQVDYIWIHEYDQYMDYDGKINTHNARDVGDAIDWGYSSLISNELVNFNLDTAGNVYVGTTNHSIVNVVSVIRGTTLFGQVSSGTGIYTGRKLVEFSTLLFEPTSVYSIKIRNTNTDLLNSSVQDQVINVVKNGSTYRLSIVLPTDIPALVVDGLIVEVLLNTTNIYALNNTPGDFSSNTITIPATNVGSDSVVRMSVNYICSSDTLFTAATDHLNAFRKANTYKVAADSRNVASNINNSTLEFQEKNIVQNIINREVSDVSVDEDGYFKLDLDMSSQKYQLVVSDVIAVIRVSDNAILWDRFNVGAIKTDPNTDIYRLMLPTTTPVAVGNKCLVFYSVRDVSNIQPLTYQMDVLQSRLEKVLLENQSTHVFTSKGSPTNPVSNIILEDPYANRLDPSRQIIIDGYLAYSSVERLPTLHFVSSSQIVNFEGVANLFDRMVDTNTAYLKYPVSSNNSGSFSVTWTGSGSTEEAKLIGFSNTTNPVNEGSDTNPLVNIQLTDYTLPPTDSMRTITITGYITYQFGDSYPLLHFISSDKPGIGNFNQVPNLLVRRVETAASYTKAALNAENIGRFNVITYDPQTPTQLKFTVPNTYGKSIPIVNFSAEGSQSNQITNIQLIDEGATDVSGDPKTVIITGWFTTTTEKLLEINFGSCVNYPGITSLSLIPNLARRRIITSASYYQVSASGSVKTQNKGEFTVKAIEPGKFSVALLDIVYHNQIAIIKTRDNQEAWSYGGTIDLANNRLVMNNISGVYPNDWVYVMVMSNRELKMSSSKLAMTVADQVNNTGTITVSGISLLKAKNEVFSIPPEFMTLSQNGFKLNMSEPIRSALGLTSADTIPTDVGIAKLVKLELVTVASSSSKDVLSVNQTLTTNNSYVRLNSLFMNETIEDRSLANYETVISSNNVIPSINGASVKLRATFYIYNLNDQEAISFTRNGTLYSDKSFYTLETIKTTAGFTASRSAELTLSSMNQPRSGSRYSAYYDYTAPKQNERLVIKYNYNDLITQTQFAIEANRPINADVLAKQAKEVGVDCTMYVVVASEFLNSKESVIQNVRDALVNAITSTSLGQTIDQNDLIGTAYTIEGVDRPRIDRFNRANTSGKVQSLYAASNEYFVPNNVNVLIEYR
jgi:hypothetical protein